MMFLDLFKVKKPIFAMLHLKGDSHADVLERVKRESDIYFENGVDAVIVEDYFGDITDVENALKYLSEQRSQYTVGVNVLDNFKDSYLLAEKYGAKFMQVDSAAGQLTPEDDIPYAELIASLRKRGTVAVVGGVRFKYQPYLSGRTLEEDLALGMQRTDAICVTGEGTGMDTDDAKIREFRRICGSFPLVVGAGVNVNTVADKLSMCDAAIVGSTFKDTRKDSGEVCAEHVREFMRAVDEIRGAL